MILKRSLPISFPLTSLYAGKKCGEIFKAEDAGTSLKLIITTSTIAANLLRVMLFNKPTLSTKKVLYEVVR